MAAASVAVAQVDIDSPLQTKKHMKHVGIGLLAAIVGYALVAAISYYLIGKFSENGHDRSVEASMTSIFFFGPVGAVVAFILGFIWSKNFFQ